MNGSMYTRSWSNCISVKHTYNFAFVQSVCSRIVCVCNGTTGDSGSSLVLAGRRYVHIFAIITISCECNLVRAKCNACIPNASNRFHSAARRYYLRSSPAINALRTTSPLCSSSSSSSRLPLQTIDYDTHTQHMTPCTDDCTAYYTWELVFVSIYRAAKLRCERANGKWIGCAQVARNGSRPPTIFLFFFISPLVSSFRRMAAACIVCCVSRQPVAVGRRRFRQ